LTRLKRYYRRFNDYINPKAVILMYHRVMELPGYAYPISVTREHFRQHMAFLKQAYHPIQLINLADAVGRRSIPRHAVAVTFDDGYADNYLNALPILDEFQIPATIFVSSGYINGCQEYWWDDLERILLETAMIPERLAILICGREHVWNLESIHQRRTVRKEIHQLLKPLCPDQREHLLETIRQWAGLGKQGRARHRSMTCDELRRLAESPLIQIGGHTVNHPQLAALPAEMQYQEIVQDRQQLEKITGKPVMTFSYPFGRPDDFLPETVEIVRTAGFEAACSVQHTRVMQGNDIFRLPRYGVGDWDLMTFANELAGFFKN
jgi:peptidoglycan/xylan/chitin deacetylase (PgdA/CDA1 family)